MQWICKTNVTKFGILIRVILCTFCDVDIAWKSLNHAWVMEFFVKCCIFIEKLKITSVCNSVATKNKNAVLSCNNRTEYDPVWFFRWLVFHRHLYNYPFSSVSAILPSSSQQTFKLTLGKNKVAFFFYFADCASSKQKPMVKNER